MQQSMNFIDTIEMDTGLPVLQRSPEQLRHESSEGSFQATQTIIGFDAFGVQTTVDLYKSMTISIPTSNNYQKSKNGDSPCFAKPVHVAPTSFYVQDWSFERVFNTVHQTLQQQPGSHFTFQFEAETQTWKCKYLKDSNVREIFISAYYDFMVNDHLLEFRRVYGDGIFDFDTDLCSALKVAFGQATSTQGKQQGFLRSWSSQSGFFVPEFTFEEFQLSFQPILTLAEDPYYESRSEAVKILCEVLLQPANIAMIRSQPELCLYPLLNTLSNLLQDHFEDIVEFAIVSITQLIERCQDSVELLQVIASYQQGTLITLLLQQLKNERKAQDYYLNTQRRRLAAQALTCLAMSSPVLVSQHLQVKGYTTRSAWMDHAEMLRDKTLRSHAVQLGDSCWPIQSC